MTKTSQLTVITIITCALFASTSNDVASAKWTQGHVGVSAYESTGNCLEGDRAGAQYVQRLHDGLVNNNLASSGTIYKDNSAWESDLTQGFANSKQFFSFSGHGYAGLTNGLGHSAHFYTLNSSTTFHTSESDGRANAQWDEIRWGSGNMRWATMHSCNFLANLGSTTKETQIWNMFRGLHLMMGYASIMYLDSREGSYYTARIGAGATIKDSFFDAASRYQPQLLPTDSSINNPSSGLPSVAARVKGYSSKSSDKWDSTTEAAPSYSSNNASNFSTWTKFITVNGNRVCEPICF